MEGVGERGGEGSQENQGDELGGVMDWLMYWKDARMDEELFAYYVEEQWEFWYSHQLDLI